MTLGEIEIVIEVEGLGREDEVIGERPAEMMIGMIPEVLRQSFQT